MSLWDFFQGKKTYIIALATLVYAITGLISGHMDQQSAMTFISTALMVMGLRNGIATTASASSSAQ